MLNKNSITYFLFETVDLATDGFLAENSEFKKCEWKNFSKKKSTHNPWQVWFGSHDYLYFYNNAIFISLYDK